MKISLPKSLSKKFLISLLKQWGVKLSGLKGWILSLVLDRFLVWANKNLQLFYVHIQEHFRQKKQEKIDEKNEQKYEEVVKPGSNPTQEELDDATSDLLNGRSR